MPAHSKTRPTPSAPNPTPTPMFPASNSPLPTTPLDTIVHLGAGPCTELDDYLATGASTIWLIEADPRIADALTARARAHEEVQVHPIALASAGGEAVLHRYNLPEANSVSPATGLLDLFPGLRLLEQLTVPAVAYADLLKPLKLKPKSGNHLLVLELPGQELQALQALQQAGQLPAFKHILLHCGREPLHADSVPAETVLQWLQEQGYDLTTRDEEQDPDRPVWAFRRNAHLIELRALRERFAELQGRFAKSEEHSKAQAGRVQVLEAAKTQAEQLAEDRAAEIQKLTHTHKALAEARNILEKQLQDTKAELETRTAEHSKLQTRHADIEDALANAQSEVNEKHCELKTLKEKLGSLQKETQTLREKSASLEQAQANLEENYRRKEKLLDEEFLKFESQIDLIKDLVFRVHSA